MKKFILILVFTISLKVGMAQAIPTFSRFYAQDSFNNSGRGVLADGDSIVLVAGLWGGDTYQSYYFIKTDLSGHEAYRTVLQKQDTAIGGSFGLDAHRSSTGDFILGTYIYNSDNNDPPLLIKLHNNLFIDFAKYIPQNDNLAYFDNTVELSDHSYLLTGCTGHVDGSGNTESLYAWMVKSDTADNIIWQHTDSQYVDYINPGVFPGGVFLESEVSISNQSQGIGGDSIVAVSKYDNDGNLKWTIGFGVPGHYNKNGPLIATRDGGGVLVINALDTSAPDLGNIFMPAVIYKFDSSGNILWQYWLSGGQFGSIVETKSGSIVLVEPIAALPLGGTVYSYLGGAFLKLDKDGNMLWQNLFFADPGYDSYFFDVAECADGGIAAIGQGTDYATLQLCTWLVKVDSNGCMNGVCPTLYSGISDISQEQGRFMVFPDPATSQYTVAITETSYMQDYRDLTLTLYDLTGRMVYEQPLTEQATTIPRGSLPSGMYMWHISDGSRSVGNGKMVMQ